MINRGRVGLLSCWHSTGTSTVVKQFTVNDQLTAGPGTTVWFTIDASQVNGSEVVLLGAVVDANGAEVSKNIMAFSAPQVR